MFFSITADAAAVKAWEPVRQAAEDNVRAVPGVLSALVALTAERAAGAAARGPQPAHVAQTARGPPLRRMHTPIPPTRCSPAFPASTR